MYNSGTYLRKALLEIINISESLIHRILTQFSVANPEHEGSSVSSGLI